MTTTLQRKVGCKNEYTVINYVSIDFDFDVFHKLWGHILFGVLYMSTDILVP